MKLKVTEAVLGYDGKPMPQVDQEGKPIQSLTWREVIFTALNAIHGDPTKQMADDDKMRAYAITKKAFDSDEPEFDVEEAAFVLQHIRRIYSPLVCGRASELFEERAK